MNAILILLAILAFDQGYCSHGSFTGLNLDKYPCKPEYLRVSIHFANMFRISVKKHVQQIYGFSTCTQKTNIAAWSLFFCGIILTPKNGNRLKHVMVSDFYGKGNEHSSMVINFWRHTSTVAATVLLLQQYCCCNSIVAATVLLL